MVAEEAVARNLGTGPLRRLLYQLAELDNDEVAARAAGLGDEEHGRLRPHRRAGAGRRVPRPDERRAAALCRDDRRRNGAGLHTDRGRVRALAALGRSALWLRRRGDRPGATGAPGRSPQRARGSAPPPHWPSPAPPTRPSRSSVGCGTSGPRTRFSTPPTSRSPKRRCSCALGSDLDPRCARHSGGGPAGLGLRSRFSELRARADAAVEQLRPAAGHERGIVAALVPAYLRGEARLLTGDFEGPCGSSEGVLDHRGTDPFSPVWPLSQLGLGRALAEMGRESEARRAYEGLLHTWSNADPDLPPLDRRGMSAGPFSEGVRSRFSRQSQRPFEAASNSRSGPVRSRMGARWISHGAVRW